MRFWGITGTNGKTTCTWITAAFIDACEGRKCGYVTTVEANTGARSFYTGYTTPPLAQLKEIFAEMEANGCTDCVMEVSSHAIHQHRTGDTVFAGGAFTNLSEDHLDYHKTMAAYFDVKLDFARQIAAAHPTTPDMGRRDLPPYVVCLDGGYGREMYNAVGNLAVNVIAVSNGETAADGTAGTSATDGTTRTDGTAGTSATNGTMRPAYDLAGLQLVGAYNRSNVLTAAALAEAAGVPQGVIQRVIPTLKPRWGRLERVENPQVKAEVYVDFAHTPDGLEKVLTAVRGMMQSTNRRSDESKNSPVSLWVVFGAGGDRDPLKRPLMGAACARLADRLVVTSDNPRSEDPTAIIEAIVKGFERFEKFGEFEKFERFERFGGLVTIEPDRKKAIEFALSEAQTGDVIVIAGKGHETTQEIKGVKYPFDDREVVRAFRM